MDKERLSLLKELTEASGVPGHEQEIKGILKKHLKGMADIEEDRMGSIIFRKKGASDKPKIMIPGHMDEVGFMVKFITDEGFIKFLTLGSWFDQTILSQRVMVKSSKGDIIGVIGSKPPHILSSEERKKVVEIKDMFIDVGAGSKKEAEEDFGIKPGDPIVPVFPFSEMKNKDYLLAKALDDRTGCALFVDVIKILQNEKHPNTVYGVGTVKEEAGAGGAKTTANLIDPDVAIVAEVGVAADVPGISPENVLARIGKGPQITIFDRSMIPNAKLRDLMIDVAKKNKIPFQLVALENGGTDGGPIHSHNKGVPSIYIGVPARYIHSHAGIINVNDYKYTLRLIVETIKTLDEETVKELIP